MGRISSPVFLAQKMRHNVPTASARPHTNLSENDKIVDSELTNELVAVSGSLESVVNEFGCEELPLRSQNDEMLPLLMLPVSPDTTQLAFLVVPKFALPKRLNDNYELYIFLSLSSRITTISDYLE